MPIRLVKLNLGHIHNNCHVAGCSEMTDKLAASTDQNKKRKENGKFSLNTYTCPNLLELIVLTAVTAHGH